MKTFIDSVMSSDGFSNKDSKIEGSFEHCQHCDTFAEKY
jgi:hypothetical protein